MNRKIERLERFNKADNLASFEELVDLNENLEDLIESTKGVDLTNVKNVKGDRGDDGYTPKKGVDYFTDKEIQAVKKEATPVKGKDYNDGEPGYTPKKGVDYFDGLDADEGAIISKVLAMLPKNEKIELDSAEALREKLESLTGKDRLRFEAIDGLDNALKALEKKIKKSAGTTIFGGASQMTVTEEDGSPELQTTVLRFSDGTVTANADGSVSIATTGGAGGQNNTASNVGTAGVGVFKQKSGVDLEFKKINAGSSKVTITDDTGNDEVDIDVDESALSLTASQISDFDTEVGNNSAVALNTAKVTYPSVDSTKVGFISVTQAVDLDQMETDINALSDGMTYNGDWDASAGTFPSGANKGGFYYVTVAGTVDSVEFSVGDNLVATTDSASTTTYAGNWSKHDQTDAVASVFGRTGSVVATSGDYTASQVTNAFDKTADDLDDITAGTTNKHFTATDESKLDGVEPLADVTDATNVKSATVSETTTASSSTPAPTGDKLVNRLYVTALAVNATISAPSGTLTNGNTLVIRIKDNATTRTLTWNSVYRAIGVTLPTATTASKTIYVGCMYNSTDSKWDVTAVAEEA